MTSHGVPRVATREQKNADAREKEFKEIENYQALIELVNTKVAEEEYTPELLQKTAELLKINPEYYTIWNHRRRIYVNEFESLSKSAADGEITQESRSSQVLDIIRLDLQFLFPLLIKYPKCYWIWNHRLWLLQQSSLLLPSDTARRLWEEELGLVGKMLSRDNRNFHGWGYRRKVVQSLESSALKGKSMTRSEFDYTTKMIGLNLSNFSAWHNRTKLILRTLTEQSATDEERRQMLDTELALIHKALFDPYDQSLWFYHHTLMCSFDPAMAAQTMAPNLDDETKLTYLAAEQEFIEELLEDVQDCKWVYQALIDCAMLVAKIKGSFSAEAKGRIHGWLGNLKELDPLRRGRWADMEKSLFV